MTLTLTCGFPSCPQTTEPPFPLWWSPFYYGFWSAAPPRIHLSPVKLLHEWSKCDIHVWNVLCACMSLCQRTSKLHCIFVAICTWSRQSFAFFCVYIFESMVQQYMSVCACLFHLSVTLLWNRRSYPSGVCLRHTHISMQTPTRPHPRTNTHMHTQRVATNRSIQMLGQAVHSRSLLALCSSAWYQHRLAPVCWGNTLLKSWYRGVVITHWPLATPTDTHTKAKGHTRLRCKLMCLAKVQ